MSSSFDKILNSLKEGKPKRIAQIAKDTKQTWDITKANLKKLEQFNQVFEKDKQYFINPNVINSETYFNLPITDKEKQKFNEYYYLIKQEWEKTTNQPLTTIHVYKILSHLNRKLKLNLSIGLYNFGECPIFIYQPSEDYIKFKTNPLPEICEEIYKAINTYKDIKPKDIREIHYKEIGQVSYQIKEVILNLLYKLNKTGITQDLIQNFQNLIKELSNDNIQPNYINYFHDFLDVLYQFKMREDKLDLDDYKEDLVDAFKDLWSLVATNYFKICFKDAYEDKTLEICFNPKLREEEGMVENHLFTLANIVRSTFDNKMLNKYFQKLKKI